MHVLHSSECRLTRLCSVLLLCSMSTLRKCRCTDRAAPDHPPHDVFSVEPLLARHVQHPVVCLIVVTLLP